MTLCHPQSLKSQNCFEQFYGHFVSRLNNLYRKKPILFEPPLQKKWKYFVRRENFPIQFSDAFQIKQNVISKLKLYNWEISKHFQLQKRRRVQVRWRQITIGVDKNHPGGCWMQLQNFCSRKDPKDEYFPNKID